MLHATHTAEKPAPAIVAERAYAEFIADIEPRCAAHRAYADEDVADIERLATENKRFGEKAKPLLQRPNYGLASEDYAQLAGCIADQIPDALTPAAARLFTADLAANSEV